MSVIVDTREDKTVASILAKRVEVRYEMLNFGDYWLPGQRVLFERKTVSDLVGTVRANRLWDQLKGLKSAEDVQPALILEGYKGKITKFTGFTEASVNGILAAIALSFGIPIIPTLNPKDTAVLVAGVALHSPKGSFPLRFKPRVENLDDASQVVVEGFPGVSSVRAKSILEHFGTVRGFVNNSYRVDECEGIGPETKKKILEVLNHKFGENNG